MGRITKKVEKAPGSNRGRTVHEGWFRTDEAGINVLLITGHDHPSCGIPLVRLYSSNIS